MAKNLKVNRSCATKVCKETRSTENSDTEIILVPTFSTKSVIEWLCNALLLTHNNNNYNVLSQLYGHAV